MTILRQSPVTMTRATTPYRLQPQFLVKTDDLSASITRGCNCEFGAISETVQAKL